MYRNSQSGSTIRGLHLISKKRIKYFFIYLSLILIYDHFFFLSTDFQSYFFLGGGGFETQELFFTKNRHGLSIHSSAQSIFIRGEVSISRSLIPPSTILQVPDNKSIPFIFYLSIPRACPILPGPFARSSDFLLLIFLIFVTISYPSIIWTALRRTASGSPSTPATTFMQMFVGIQIVQR